jgi:hypothetical protein
VALQKFIGGSLDLVADGYLTLRAANDIAVVGNGLQNALTNPPDGIRDELKTTRIVELVGSCDEANVTLVDEIGKGKALMLVLFGNRYHEAEIGADQLLPGLIGFTASGANGLGQFDFLLGRNHGNATNLDKVFVE